MKELVIPDIHQRISALERILDRWEKEVDRVIFLGDYFDEKGAGLHDTDNADTTISWLLDSLKQTNRIHLLGNHDLSYRWPNGYSCSGRQDSTVHLVDSIFSEDDWSQFHYAISTQGWLISHAGFHPLFLGSLSDNESLIDQALTMATSLQTSPDPEAELLQAGAARGGELDFGGIVWLDWNYEFQPIEGINQLVGHTFDPFQARCMEINDTGEVKRNDFSLDQIDGNDSQAFSDERRSTNWCIDCGLNVVAIIESGQLSLHAVG